MGSYIVKLLASVVVRKVAIKVIVAVLRELAKKTENTLDDRAIDALVEALEEN
jgi:hypothetical protein